ncbi:single-stranded DNA-binding protein [Candidatus Sumerlaeota bacterium]|nr:single-stranded DNA-binding protein [Candidatus Sumerlaeota bacterium]MBI3736823.1 single-stranded DNA-binding protein [Candidatus Sumerlaeota bacterium]
MIEFNKVFLSARLTRDPELKYIPSGTAVCEMGVAADRQFPGKSGEKQKETLFINVQAWAKTAEFCNEYFRKGSAIFVEGRLKLDQWKDKETGKNQNKIYIVADRVQFGESKAEAQARAGRGGGDGGNSGGGSEPEYSGSASAPEEGGGTTDDLPF